MSHRTIVEINHDYLHDLQVHPDELMRFVDALKQGIHNARKIAPSGIRILGERHHSETLKLTVR